MKRRSLTFLNQLPCKVLFFTLCAFAGLANIAVSKTVHIYPTQPRWNAQMTTQKQEQIEKDLETEKLKKLIPLREFLKEKGFGAEFDSPEIYLAILNNELKGVFKVRNPQEMNTAYAEVAAYKASKFLGINIVPPTVIRTFNNKIGSLQFYVEPSIDLLKSGNFFHAMGSTNPDDVANLKTFCFVFGQWDHKPANFIAQMNEGQYKLALVDNEAIICPQKVRHGDFPFIKVRTKWTFSSSNPSSEGEDFPFDEDVKPITKDPASAEKALGKELAHSFRYLQKVDHPIFYRIWKGGFWHQIYKGSHNPAVQPIYVNFCPKPTLIKLKALNKEHIKNFFALSSKNSFLNEEHINHILNRRDQLLKELGEN